MSVSKKQVLNYSKSLFQNANALPFEPIALEPEIVLEENEVGTNGEQLPTPNLGSSVAPMYFIGEELRLRSALIQNAPTLKSALQTISPYNLNKSQKLKLVVDLFPSALPTLLLNFFTLLAEKNELSLIPDISLEYNRLLYAFERITPITLIGATPFQSRQGLSVLNTLKDLTSSNEIIVTAGYQKRLLGGLVIEYQSCAIDASIFKEFSSFLSDAA